MKKITIALLISIIAIGVFSSCNKNKSYAQHLNEEKKSIERFINQNDLIILREYPKDSVFKNNEFYFDTSSGIYYNVIDSGNGRRIKGGEEFYIRFKGLKYIYLNKAATNDTLTYSNTGALQPEVLVYGNSSTYSSVSWVAPLKNVGDRAKVKMIVPFKMGMPNDIQLYKTAYYEVLNYQFEQ